jgi:hypothetical protein
MLPGRSRRSPIRYNSAVYASLVTNDYHVFVVSQAFVDGTAHGDCKGFKTSMYSTLLSNYTASFEHLTTLLRNNSLQRVERRQCITEYAEMVQPTRRNLLLVATNEDVKPRTNVSTGLPIDRPCIEDVKNNIGVYYGSDFSAQDGLYHGTAADSYRWLCSGLEMPFKDTCTQRIEDVKRAPQWKVTDFHCVSRNNQSDLTCEEYQMWPVDYCLSEQVTARCELHFSTTIALIVTSINFCKFIHPPDLYSFAHNVC